MRLTTPRLQVRTLEPEDAAAVYAYRSDAVLMRYQLWEPRDVDEVRAFIAELREAALGATAPGAAGTWHQLAITLRATGELIGDVGLHFMPGAGRQVELGITLAGAHHGQGYAAEALRAVIAHLAAEMGIQQVCARVDARNTASRRLMERLGLREDPAQRERVWAKGEWCEDVVYSGSGEQAG
ncbi:MAG: GNAT family N-acetyltransferase [Chloroflexota bacterium]